MADAGAGWYGAGDTPRAGRVVAVFRRAVYLRFGERILAVGSAIPAGPLHLRTPRFSSVAWTVGSPAWLGDGRFQAGHLAVDLFGCRRWKPAAVDPIGLARGARRFGLARIGGAPCSGRRPSPGIGLPPKIIAEAGEAVGGRDLVWAAAILAGLGPGLTPSGDDLLAGVLLVDAVLRPGQRRGREAAVAVACTRTNEVAAAFLRWAGAGQSIQPVHDLLAAIESDDYLAAALAADELTSIGASSGAAILEGIDLALRRAGRLDHDGAHDLQRWSMRAAEASVAASPGRPTFPHVRLPRSAPTQYRS